MSAGKYRTILADPPWPMAVCGNYLRREKQKRDLPYDTMTVESICALRVNDLAEPGAHLWLWVTNQFLEQGFQVMRAWGFKYLAPITWVKPSGFGNYFVHRTEHILFGYKQRCEFNKARYIPNVYEWGLASAHSRKPVESYRLIESISDAPRLELFARPITPMFPTIEGWSVWGNEVESNIELRPCEKQSATDRWLNHEETNQI